MLYWLSLYLDSALICVPLHCHVVDDDLYFLGCCDLPLCIRHKAEFNHRPFNLILVSCFKTLASFCLGVLSISTLLVLFALLNCFIILHYNALLTFDNCIRDK